MSKNQTKWTSIRVTPDVIEMLDNLNDQRAERMEPRLSKWQLIQILCVQEIRRLEKQKPTK